MVMYVYVLNYSRMWLMEGDGGYNNSRGTSFKKLGRLAELFVYGISIDYVGIECSLHTVTGKGCYTDYPLCYAGYYTKARLICCSTVRSLGLKIQNFVNVV